MKRPKAIKIVLIIALFLAVISFSSFLYYNYDIPILMYHHIDIGPAGSSLYVSPENFEKQMQFLYKDNYRVIALPELAALLVRSAPLPRRTVAVTFDDGYEDNYIHAYKILKKYNFPAVMFVCPDLVGKKGYLNWEQIKEMSKNNIIIGSHTSTHAYLPGLSKEEIIKELSASREKLKKELKQEISYLCYPVGGFSKEIQDLARLARYRMVFTTNRGILKTRRNRDLMALRRIKIKDSANRLVLRAKLSGYYNLFRSIKDPY